MLKQKIIYIFGAGRSGSTILATVLNDHEAIQHVGELHHFLPYLKEDDLCSCGLPLSECIYWSKVIGDLPWETNEEIDSLESLSHQVEYHRAIPLHLIGLKKSKHFKEYKEAQQQILQSIGKNSPTYILDSAKYIGRFLALRKIYGKRIKGVFLIRDLRGVIWSFQKKVQTQSPPFRTILYYALINTIGQLLSFILPNDQIIKIRYEDIVDQPAKTFRNIGAFLELDFSKSIEKIENKKSFQIAHIVGGNRLKRSDDVILQKDDDWLKNMPRAQKIFYYLVMFPLMFINRYRMLK